MCSHLALDLSCGQNAIRLLFNHEAVLEDLPIDPAELKLAPELKGTTYLQMFTMLAQAAAKRGLLVLFGCHRLSPTAWPGKGLWYDTDAGLDEARILESWDKVAAALCAEWNVFAVDLQNEPHAASWGFGKATDWDRAAARIGNRVLDACPRWMIFVEGVGYSPGAPGGDDPADGFWWGGNLVGAKLAPVVLQDQRRLVYSPHTYGPGTFEQPYFKAPGFPRNMDGVWDAQWAFVAEETGQPLVLGEIGGFYTGKDQVWQDWAIAYCAEHHIGVFYFGLNPGSEDTGGLLQDDWTTPNAGKLRLLGQLPSTSVAIVETFMHLPPPPSPPPPGGPPLPPTSPLPPGSPPAPGAPPLLPPPPKPPGTPPVPGAPPSPPPPRRPPWYRSPHPPPPDPHPPPPPEPSPPPSPPSPPPSPRAPRTDWWDEPPVPPTPPLPPAAPDELVTADEFSYSSALAMGVVGAGFAYWIVGEARKMNWSLEAVRRSVFARDHHQKPLPVSASEHAYGNVEAIDDDDDDDDDAHAVAVGGSGGGGAAGVRAARVRTSGSTRSAGIVMAADMDDGVYDVEEDIREEEVEDDHGVDWSERVRGVRASLMEGVMD